MAHQVFCSVQKTPSSGVPLDLRRPADFAHVHLGNSCANFPVLSSVPLLSWLCIFHTPGWCQSSGQQLEGRAISHPTSHLRPSGQQTQAQRVQTPGALLLNLVSLVLHFVQLRTAAAPTFEGVHVSFEGRHRTLQYVARKAQPRAERDSCCWGLNCVPQDSC